MVDRRRPPPIAGVVLAGGASTRFGSDKLGAPLAGRPLVLHALDRLGQVPGLTRIVVVVPPRPVSPGWLPAVAEVASVVVVRDEIAFDGPLAGLVAGLGALADDDVALVVAGDMPFLDAVVLGDLSREIVTRADVDVAFLASDGRDHPLPLALAVRPARPLADELLRGGERSLRALLDAFERRRRLTAFDPAMLRDVDTPIDLDRARE